MQKNEKVTIPPKKIDYHHETPTNNSWGKIQSYSHLDFQPRPSMLKADIKKKIFQLTVMKMASTILAMSWLWFHKSHLPTFASKSARRTPPAFSTASTLPPRVAH